MHETQRAAEDAVIYQRIKELRYDRIRCGRPCGIQAGTGSVDCWCKGLGKNGNSLPCPSNGADYPANIAELDF
jgi:hypothetical protein